YERVMKLFTVDGLHERRRIRLVPELLLLRMPLVNGTGARADSLSAGVRPDSAFGIAVAERIVLSFVFEKCQEKRGNKSGWPPSRIALRRDRLAGRSLDAACLDEAASEASGWRSLAERVGVFESVFPLFTDFIRWCPNPSDSAIWR